MTAAQSLKEYLVYVAIKGDYFPPCCSLAFVLLDPFSNELYRDPQTGKVWGNMALLKVSAWSAQDVITQLSLVFEPLRHLEDYDWRIAAINPYSPGESNRA